VSHQKGISGIKDKAGFESSNRAALSTGKMSAGCEKNFAMGSRFDRSGGLLFGDCIEAEGKPTVKYTITVAVEGFVQIDVEATSRSKAVDQAMEIFNDSSINIVVTDKSIADVEKWT
jgi:hypothetical protein